MSNNDPIRKVRNKEVSLVALKAILELCNTNSLMTLDNACYKFERVIDSHQLTINELHYMITEELQKRTRS